MERLRERSRSASGEGLAAGEHRPGRPNGLRLELVGIDAIGLTTMSRSIRDWLGSLGTGCESNLAGLP
jgi:hypothetical protein